MTGASLRITAGTPRPLGPSGTSEVRTICPLYHQAQELLERGVHLRSTDRSAPRSDSAIRPSLAESLSPRAVLAFGGPGRPRRPIVDPKVADRGSRMTLRPVVGLAGSLSRTRPALGLPRSTRPAGFASLHASQREKTGLQALERIHPDRAAVSGQLELREFESRRHGTQVLMANFEVATGQIVRPTVRDTRTEADFVAHIRTTVAAGPGAEWIFVVDPLNTHQSAGLLVRLIAQLCGIQDDLGRKDESAVLQSLLSRQAFLEDEAHRVRFVYTPQHCSWLNQVEIWFSILSRRLLTGASFTSTDALRHRLLAFVKVFNETTSAKPFLWTYIGKPLTA